MKNILTGKKRFLCEGQMNIKKVFINYAILAWFLNLIMRCVKTYQDFCALISCLYIDIVPKIFY